jgi:hypothetical protein
MTAFEAGRTDHVEEPHAAATNAAVLPAARLPI